MKRPVDLSPVVRIIENMPQRVTVADTDEGKEMARQVEELQDLIQAYRSGVLEERA